MVQRPSLHLLQSDASAAATAGRRRGALFQNAVYRRPGVGFFNRRPRTELERCETAGSRKPSPGDSTSIEKRREVRIDALRVSCPARGKDVACRAKDIACHAKDVAHAAKVARLVQTFPRRGLPRPPCRVSVKPA